jgi:hypothetical protein
LGLQDAARKRWIQSQRLSDKDVVTKAVTQERQEKLQYKISWIAK